MRRAAAGVVLLLLAAVGAAAETVKAIRVRGVEGPTTAEEEVRAFTRLRAGDEFDRTALARDLRELERSGRFSRVNAAVEAAEGGVVVTYVVQPRLRIRSFRIEGALDIGNKKVRELLEISVGDLFDEGQMGARRQKVLAHYQKNYYPYAEVSWTVQPDPEGGTCELLITVKEGQRAKIHAVKFEGNEHASTKDLRKVITQKQANIWSWITGSGALSPDAMDPDREAVVKSFYDRGYLEAEVGAPEVRPYGERKVDLVIPVREGRQFRIRSLSITGNTLFATAVLQQLVTNRAGDVASMSRLEAAATALRDYYGARGYVNTRVDPVTTPDLDRATVDVEFRIREGKMAYLRNVYIRGNTKTRDKVIRREISAYPGEPYNEVKIRSSERRLRNMKLFSSVLASPQDTIDPEKKDLIVNVEEGRAGQVSFGVGFSSIDNLIGFVELQQGNFDISRWPPVGAGQKFRVRGVVGSEREDLEVSFVEPWFMERRLTLSVDAYLRDLRYLSDEYDQQNEGVRLGIGRALGTFDRLNLIYGIENYNIYNVDEEASQTIKDEEGSRIKSSLTLQYVRDSRNDSFIPTRGNRTVLSSQYAGGPLGGETDIYEFEAQSSQYIPLWFEHVLAFRAEAAVVDTHSGADRVPIFDRLFLGGARTLRGFDYRDVGPRDEYGEPVGGLSRWYATAEYTVPIVEMVRFATFYDIGMVYEDAYEFDFGHYNSDWGFGVRLDFPGFPIRLDYAWPLETDPENDSSGGRFQFSVGFGL